MRILLVVAAAAALIGCGSQPAKQQAQTAPPEPVKISFFYAGAAAVERGDSVSLCYGVENAAGVRIEPPVEGVSPSPNRCVPVTPARNAEYKLVATGRDGKEASQVVSVRVLPKSARKAPQPQAASDDSGLITAFAATATQVSAGQPVTICFDARRAESIRLEPAPAVMPSGGKGCVAVRPQRTTTYKLTAGGGGHTETRQVTITIQ